jgi:hypothetical protein
LSRTAERTREQKLRRMAERQGLKLEKSRQRDPRGLDFGNYRLSDPYNNTVVAGSGGPYAYSMDLDAIEAALLEGREP